MKFTPPINLHEALKRITHNIPLHRELYVCVGLVVCCALSLTQLALGGLAVWNALFAGYAYMKREEWLREDATYKSLGAPVGYFVVMCVLVFHNHLENALAQILVLSIALCVIHASCTPIQVESAV